MLSAHHFKCVFTKLYHKPEAVPQNELRVESQNYLNALYLDLSLYDKKLTEAHHSLKNLQFAVKIRWWPGES